MTFEEWKHRANFRLLDPHALMLLEEWADERERSQRALAILEDAISGLCPLGNSTLENDLIAAMGQAIEILRGET